MIVKSGNLSISQVKKSDELKFLILSKNYLREILKKKISKEKNDSNLKKIRKNHGKIFWILKKKFKIGFVVIYINKDFRAKKKNCYIRDIYIKKHFRLKKFGKIVVSKIIEYFIKKKFNFIKIDILPTNKKVIKFWGKFDFKKRGKSYYLSLK